MTAPHDMPPLPRFVSESDAQMLMDYALAAIAPYKAENANLRTTLETVLHAFSEIHHASTRPDLFTLGQEGATRHRLNWERLCIATIKTALGEKK